MPVVDGSGATANVTQGLTAAINFNSKLTVGGSVALSPGASKFSSFQAALPISYWVRSTPGGTGGAVTAKVTSDFTPVGGPTVASGALQYTCTAATYGTACSGTQDLSTTTSTPVLTLPKSACTGGGGVCSTTDPNTINLNFTLTDSPAYPTGSYSAVVTFTISAT
jgi:hypothetical protein